MNLRIRELLLKAGWDRYEALDERNQKFAELIVGECIDVVDQWKKEPFPLDADLLRKEIRKHFGVDK